MILNTEWDNVVKEEFKKPYFIALSQAINLARERGKIIYPLKGKVFTAFNKCDYNKTKVVIINREPYPNSNSDGIALNWGDPVRKRVPFEYEIMIKAINTQVYKDSTKEVLNDFENLCNQGVLLLNSVLTVTKDEPFSHRGKGWEIFTTEIIKALCNKRTPVVYIIFGETQINYQQLIRYSNHLIIHCEHPLEALKNIDKYWNNKDCFNVCNQYLIKHGIEPIEWNQELPF